MNVWFKLGRGLNDVAALLKQEVKIMENNETNLSKHISPSFLIESLFCNSVILRELLNGQVLAIYGMNFKVKSLSFEPLQDISIHNGLVCIKSLWIA